MSIQTTINIRTVFRVSHKKYYIMLAFVTAIISSRSYYFSSYFKMKKTFIFLIFKSPIKVPVSHPVQSLLFFHNTDLIGTFANSHGEIRHSLCLLMFLELPSSVIVPYSISYSQTSRVRVGKRVRHKGRKAIFPIW